MFPKLLLSYQGTSTSGETDDQTETELCNIHYLIVHKAQLLKHRNLVLRYSPERTTVMGKLRAESESKEVIHWERGYTQEWYIKMLLRFQGMFSRNKPAWWNRWVGYNSSDSSERLAHNNNFYHDDWTDWQPDFLMAKQTIWWRLVTSDAFYILAGEIREMSHRCDDQGYNGWSQACPTWSGPARQRKQGGQS